MKNHRYALKYSEDFVAKLEPLPSRENGYSASSNAEKKLKLFGVELTPSRNDESNMKGSAEGDESERSLIGGLDDKKFECQYCLKEFANSQALGGHQNAHKKERMKKKRLQLQARKASLNCYLQPYSQAFANSNGNSTVPWFYSPSSEFTVYDESQICFNNPFDQDAHVNGSQLSKWHAVPAQVSFQQDSCSFTLTHSDRSRENRPNIFKPSALPASKQSYKSLDLQLGMNMQANIRSSSRSGR
nr:zinc finger protein 5 [Quercus suber]